MYHARSLDQDTKNGRHLLAKLLASKADQVGARDHGNVGENEDGEVAVGQGIADSYSSRDNRPEDIDSGRDLARGASDDAEKVHGREPSAATLTGGLDAGRHGRVAVAIVVLVHNGVAVAIGGGGEAWLVRRGLSGLFRRDGHGGGVVAVQPFKIARRGPCGRRLANKLTGEVAW